jgi:hypothetical protein
MHLSLMNCTLSIWTIKKRQFLCCFEESEVLNIEVTIFKATIDIESEIADVANQGITTFAGRFRNLF